MTKIKTSELTGAALDWAVAKIEGYSLPPFPGRAFSSGEKKECWINVSPSGHDVFAPSTNWAQGGPIIDRERITLIYDDVPMTWWCAGIARTNKEGYYFEYIRRGPTALVAAMRYFVTSKMGDTVDIPDELL